MSLKRISVLGGYRGKIMIKLKFSHDCIKMPPNPNPSRLIEVFVINRPLHPSFMMYDTEIVDGGNYILPAGKVLVLLLLTINDALWTTIRKYTVHKERMYREHRGRSFEVVIECP